MSAPNNIAIILNAADAIDDYEEAGEKYPLPREEVDRDVLLDVIDFNRRLLLRLGGRAISGEVLLRVDDVDIYHGVLRVTNTIEPPFSASYHIADEPAPSVQFPHGDMEFHLRLTSGG